MADSLATRSRRITSYNVCYTKLLRVTRFERTGANGGFARYALTIEPWLAFLGYRRDSYVFQDKTVFEIVDEMLA